MRRNPTHVLKFPKIISSEVQETCFNKHMLSQTTNKSVKDVILTNVIETLPYMTDNNDLDWMESTYFHPTDRTVTLDANDDEANIGFVSTLQSFSSIALHEKVFPGLSASFPYRLDQDKFVFDNKVGSIVNPDDFHLNDIGTFSPQTLEFIQFRLRHPEAISRLAGGFISGEYLNHTQQDPNIKYLDPVDRGNGYVQVPMGTYVDNGTNSICMFNHMSSNRIALTDISDTFKIPADLPTFYSSQRRIEKDPIFQILESAYRVLPELTFNFILQAYELTSYWAKYIGYVGARAPVKSGTLQNLDLLLAAARTARTGQPASNFIGWKNENIGQAALNYNDINNAAVGSAPIDRTWYRRPFPGDVVSYNIGLLVPASFSAADLDAHRRNLMDHITTLYYFGKFVGLNSNDTYPVSLTYGLESLGYYYDNGNNDEIEIVPINYVSMLLKTKYLLTFGINTYKSICATINQSEQDPTNFFNGEKRYVYEHVAKPAAANPNNPPVGTWRFLWNNAQCQANLQASGWKFPVPQQPLVPQALVPPPVPVPQGLAPNDVQYLNMNSTSNLTPEDVEFIGKYVLEFNPDEHIYLEPGMGNREFFGKKFNTTARGKQLDMFWKGMTIDDWTNLCLFKKALINKLSLVMGLYEREVLVNNNTVPITFCGVLSQIPKDMKVTRVCFLPYTYGDRTLYSTLKDISKNINEHMDKINALTRREYKKELVSAPNPKLEMTPIQFDTFMAMVNEADSPVKVLAAYCIVMSESANPNKETVKFVEFSHYVQTLWILLTKLGYNVSFRNVSADDTGKIYVRPPINLASLEQTLQRKHRGTPYEKVIGSLIVKARPLVDFLLYPIRMGRDETLGMARDKAGAGLFDNTPESSIFIKNDKDCDVISFGEFYNNDNEVDVKAVAEASLDDFRNIEMLHPEYSRFYENASNVYLNTLDMDQGIKEIAKHVPYSIPAQQKLVAAMTKDNPVTSENVMDIIKKLDCSGGVLLDDVLGEKDYTDVNTDRIDLELKRIVAMLDKSLGIKRPTGGFSSYHIPPFDPFEHSRTKYLTTALHGVSFMNQVMSQIRNMEWQNKTGVSTDFKNQIMDNFRNIFYTNRSLYKMAMQLDLVHKTLDILRNAGHPIEDGEITADLFEIAYDKLRPLATKVLNDFDGRIGSALKQIYQSDPTIAAVDLEQE